MRNEIVLSCKNFVMQRLDDEQMSISNRIDAFIKAKSVTEVISAARVDVENLFGADTVSEFTDNVISLHATGELPPPSDMTCSTARIYHYLKVSQLHSIFSKLVQSYLILSPHSTGTERAVSLHTILKSSKQLGLSREAINSRMYIALNGTGTAHYDPRPAVAKFLESKERRRKLPDKELYQSQDYIKKFFAKNNQL